MRSSFLSLIAALAIILCIAPIASVAAQPYSVPNASVTVTGPGTGFTTTNSTGNFSISTLPVGNYSVFITAPGYVNLNTTATVTANSTNNLGQVYLNGSGIITGFVVSPSGVGVAGVYLILSSNGSFVDSTVSTSNGNFTLDQNIVTGNYSISAFVPSNSSLPYAPPLTATSVSAVQGNTTSAGNITLVPSGTITGIVNDTTGAGVANITVTAVNTATNLSTIYYGYATTASSGTFSITSGLATGNYSVSLAGTAPGNIVNVTPVTVNVTAGNTSTVNFTLQPSGTISGTVTYNNSQPVSGAVVDAVSTSTNGTAYYGTATTTANGTYAINSGLGTGSYTVTADLGGILATASSVSVTAGNTTYENLSLPTDPAYISGTIIDNTTSLAIPSVNVTGIYSLTISGVTSSYSNYTTTDVNGNYTLVVNALPGNTSVPVNVTASIAGYNVASTIVNVTAGATPTGVDFNLTPVSVTTVGNIAGSVVSNVAPPVVSNVTLSLTPSSTSISANSTLLLTGSLLSNGTGVAGAMITIAESINGSAVTTANVTTASDGSYTYNITPLTVGSYTFQSSWAGNSTVAAAVSPLANVTVTTALPVPTITISVTPTSIKPGASVTISGTISMNATGTITIEQSLNGSALAPIYNATIVNGNYTYTYTISNPGTYTFVASYPGSATLGSAVSSSSSTVTASTTSKSFLSQYWWVIVIIVIIIIIIIIAAIAASRSSNKPKTKSTTTTTTSRTGSGGSTTTTTSKET